MVGMTAGVDFAILSMRASMVSSRQGHLGTGVAEYPLCCSERDLNSAMESA